MSPLDFLRRSRVDAPQSVHCAAPFMRSTTHEPMLHATDVYAEVAGRHVLRGASLALRRADTCLLLGGNGAGKSTLLSILSGLLPPDSGHVGIGHLGGDPRSAEVRRLIGYAPDVHPIDLRLTVNEYLWLLGRLQGLAKAELRARIGVLLDEWALAEILEVPLEHCSHGMTKRVGLAAALLHEPAVLLLDEPEAGLDAGTKATLVEALRRESAAGACALVVTHQPDVYGALRPSTLTLADGRIGTQQEGHEHAA